MSRHNCTPKSAPSRTLLGLLARGGTPNTLPWALAYGGRSPNATLRRTVLSLYRPGHFVMVLRSMGLEREGLKLVEGCWCRRDIRQRDYHLSRDFILLCRPQCRQCVGRLRALLKSKKFTLADLRFSGGVEPLGERLSARLEIESTL